MGGFDARGNGSWICGPEEGIRYSPKSDGDGNSKMDGSTRSRSQGCGSNV